MNSSSSTNRETISNNASLQEHQKRLSNILQYIAMMHTSTFGSTGETSDASNLFVRKRTNAEQPPPFFYSEDGNVICTTETFRALYPEEPHDGANDPDWKKKKTKKLPFTFFGPTEGSSSSSISTPASPSSRKRPTFDRNDVKRPTTSASPSTSRPWLRLTRLSQGKRCLSEDDDSISMVHQAFQPIYNRCFEFIQQSTSGSLAESEAIWGLGHAYYVDTVGNIIVNGPLLEVPVEMELGPRDGAIYIRPKSHGGVTIQRDVLMALLSSKRSNTACDTTLQQWLTRVSTELTVGSIAPAQPLTYTPMLQRMAMELSSLGVFQWSSDPDTTTPGDGALRVTEAWCLYIRPKPSSVLARDAHVFADQVLQSSSGIPPATWALTHGPGSWERYEQSRTGNSGAWYDGRAWATWMRSHFTTTKVAVPTPPKIILPLPSSEAQNRIATLLLHQNCPAVVVEGPPGTGKSQTICNILAAYLSAGRRVLVTSKNASSLSVIRNRLPRLIQELCVDVSNSESNGVRQLQQTVERLSHRLSQPSTAMETDPRVELRSTIDSLEKHWNQIDDAISSHRQRVYQVLKHPDGQRFVEIAVELLESMPWLMSTIASWTPYQVMQLRDRIQPLVLRVGDPIIDVAHIPMSPSNALISLAASYAQKKVHVLSTATKKAVAGIPVLGSWTGMDRHTQETEHLLSQIRICRRQVPETPEDWSLVEGALRRAQKLYQFGQGEWKSYERSHSWPDAATFCSDHDRLRGLFVNIEKAVEMKQIAWKLNLDDMIAAALHCQSLDTQRFDAAKRIQELSEALVNATVVAELNRSFSDEALSALIHFSQIAGKAKFQKSNLPKMSQRQRRHRQEYLHAFDQCCRYIPCWILTTSQISDFLPPECLFDLVIVDETSQSDITVLPTLLRGKQWLIVGDGKQVSPTETFISEDQMDLLRSALPQSYFDSALLPGQSFFDLCAQAFPTSRVVLNEHFRCASEIISFSNNLFYDNQLIPLRLPKPSERLTPSIIDVRVLNGVKEGKINESEVCEIVRRVVALVTSEHSAPSKRNSKDAESFPVRTIGVISLMGDEQSRLIRSRLLDAIGPQRMAQHSILVGDPPSFQGTERDIIILSMVCSPGRTPTQSQLVHYQRANVAMSRARDQCILVRSLEISDIPSSDDVKIPIIAFFQASCADSKDIEDGAVPYINELPMKLSKSPVLQLLIQRLSEIGYKVRSMGIVWKNGICVEHPSTDVRVALMVDDTNDFYPDWQAGYQQQQKIERVGWKCRRVDVLSLLIDFAGTVQSITQVLSDAGISISTHVDTDLFRGDESVAFNDDERKEVARLDVARNVHNIAEESKVIDDIITITSEDDDDMIQKRGQYENDDDTKKFHKSLSLRSSKRLRSDISGNAKQSIYAEFDHDSEESLYDFDSDESAVVDLSFLRRGSD